MRVRVVAAVVIGGDEDLEEEDLGLSDSEDDDDGMNAMTIT